MGVAEGLVGVVTMTKEFTIDNEHVLMLSLYHIQ